MNELKVSIVIPCYNVDKYIEECLNSVLNQTYSNLEVVVIDDGSNDGTRRILEEYQNRYRNIKLLIQKNKGMGSARNAGVRVCSGDYLLFVDADDYIQNDTIETLVNAVSGKEIEIAYYGIKSFLDDETEEKKLFEYTPLNDFYRIISGKEYVTLCINNDCYYVSIWQRFISTEFLKSINLSFRESILYEDNAYSLKLDLSANRVISLPEKMYFRRVRSNSIMTSKICEKNIESNQINIEDCYGIYNNFNLNSEERVLVLKFIKERIYSQIEFLILSEDRKCIKKFSVKLRDLLRSNHNLVDCKIIYSIFHAYAKKLKMKFNNLL